MGLSMRPMVIIGAVLLNTYAEGYQDTISKLLLVFITYTKFLSLHSLKEIITILIFK